MAYGSIELTIFAILVRITELMSPKKKIIIENRDIKTVVNQYNY